MTFHSNKRYTQINLNPREVNSLSLNNVSSASRNTQGSSISQNDIAGSANRKPVDSTRSDVEQETRKSKLSPSNDLHSSRQRASAEVSTERDDATDKFNGKRRNFDIDDVEIAFASEPMHQNLSASARPEAWQDTSLRVKDEFPWRTYDEDYNLRIDGLITIAKKKRSASKMTATEDRSASEVVAIRKLSDSSRSENLFRLLQIQRQYFVKCIETYEFEADLYIVLEHMSISLVQVVAASIHPQEAHVTAIVEQIRLQLVWLKCLSWRIQMLSGIEFLESKNIVHDNIICSNILLNNDDHVKIDVQKCCTIISKEDNINHSDVQTIEDIMMQLLKKRRKSDKIIDANDLRRWFSTTKEFLSKIKSAFAEKLLQISLNLSRCRLP